MRMEMGFEVVDRLVGRLATRLSGDYRTFERRLVWLSGIGFSALVWLSVIGALIHTH